MIINPISCLRVIDWNVFTLSFACVLSPFIRTRLCFARWGALRFSLERRDVFPPVLSAMRSRGKKHFRVALLWLIICEGEPPPPSAACSPLAALRDHMQPNPISNWWVGLNLWIFSSAGRFCWVHALEETVRLCKIISFLPPSAVKKRPDVSFCSLSNWMWPREFMLPFQSPIKALEYGMRKDLCFREVQHFQTNAKHGAFPRFHSLFLVVSSLTVALHSSSIHQLL